MRPGQRGRCLCASSVGARAGGARTAGSGAGFITRGLMKSSAERHCDLRGVSTGSSAPQKQRFTLAKRAWGCVIRSQLLIVRAAGPEPGRAANRRILLLSAARWRGGLAAFVHGRCAAGTGGLARRMACRFRRSTPCARTILRRVTGKGVAVGCHAREARG